MTRAAIGRDQEIIREKQTVESYNIRQVSIHKNQGACHKKNLPMEDGQLTSLIPPPV
jgi:hypothetical protein